MRRMARVFNDFDEDGRQVSVLLYLQHAFEMLLKAGLVQRHVRVFDKRLGRSIGFEKCVNLAAMHLDVTEDEAGLLRAVDALRDEAQHWLTDVSEALLYIHCRGAVTLSDRLLGDVFGERLADHLPVRVLPLSTEPPRDIQLLIDDQFSQVQALLQPGRRRRPEARAGIRTLLALEAHGATTDEGVRVSTKDVNRVERAIRAGQDRHQVFPTLSTLGTQVAGEGLHVSVRFVKRGGAPVTYVPADADVDAAAVREVDLQRKYYLGAKELADKLGVTTPRAKAIRWKLGIDDDDDCRHVFRFGKSRFTSYSDNAYVKMRDLMQQEDLEEVWAEYRRSRGS